ncbi:MAG: hypothetical protein MI700_10690 [Balneolales bacterium]|nr:hypothetical protein [Balneolales bacterium]
MQIKHLLLISFISLFLGNCSLFENEQEDSVLVDVLTANSWVLLPVSIPDQNFREPWFIEMNFFKDGSYVYEHMLLDEDRDLIGHLVYEKGAYEIRNGSFYDTRIYLYDAPWDSSKGEYIIQPFNIDSHRVVLLDHPTNVADIILSENTDTLRFIYKCGLSNSCSIPTYVAVDN